MNSSGQTFRHQVVADLAWALSSPPLMQPVDTICEWPQATWFQRIYHEALPWLQLLDNDPSELVELLSHQKDHRLGKYFETLWYFWLQKQSRYEIVETNLQLIIDGQTLGEMDFILFDTEQRCFLHWEVAVKFYLGVGDTRLQSNWHGPGRKDRLDKKFRHLIQRQCVISREPQVRDWLLSKGIEIDNYQVILKGRLYYQGNPGLRAGAPAQSAQQHLRSFWLPLDAFEALVDGSFRFRPLIKEGWMAKVSTNSKSENWNKSELLEALSNKDIRLPLHVLSSKPLFSNCLFFIVDENWSAEFS